MPWDMAGLAGVERMLIFVYVPVQLCRPTSMRLICPELL